MTIPMVNKYERSWRIGALSGVLLVAINACFCFHPRLCAQTSDSRSVENKSWTATTDLKGQNLNPERIVENHSQTGNRTLDEQSVQIRGSDEHFEPYEDIATETLQVDADTVRTTTRTFVRDVNRIKKLVDVTEEEKHTVPGGDSKIVRLFSTSDLNGRLQPVRREIVETKSLGMDTEETNTTIMLGSINGGLAPAIKTHELRKRVADDRVETEKTTWFLDVNRNWQVSEVRQAATRQEGTNRTTEERVSWPDSEGKLGVVSRSVSQESESGSGEKHSVVETYSIDRPGAAPDGSLYLIERKTSTESSSSTGERATEQKVEKLNPGHPGSGLRVYVVVDGRMVPEPSGEQSTVTIRARDLNGNFGIVSVQMTKSDRIPSIQVQQTPAEKP
jgi:hypothetical protein